jgi:hypothetical protein
VKNTEIIEQQQTKTKMSKKKPKKYSRFLFF